MATYQRQATFTRDISFLSLGSLFLISTVITIMFLVPESSPLEPNQRSMKSQHLEDSFGFPDKFAEYFASAQGLNAGYPPYPQGHKWQEFQNALWENAKRGTNSATLDWIERGPGRIGGRTRAVLVDPSDPMANTWYVASVGGGVWRGHRFIDDFGQEQVEWTPLTDDLPSLAATTLDISRNNPNVMYLGTGEGFFNVDAAAGVGMFKSTDKGESWIHLSATTLSGESDWRYVNRLVVHPDNPDLVVVATNTGIFRTENGGQSFSKVYTTDRRVQDLRANPDNFNIQFATVHGTAILRSVDGGKTWEESLAAFPYSPERIEIAISSSDPNVIWASAEGSGDRSTTSRRGGEVPVSDFYRSIDGGESWRFIDFSDEVPGALTGFLEGQGWYDNMILVHPFSPDTAYLGGVDRYRVWVDGSSDPTSITIGNINRFNNAASFIDFINFGANAVDGTISLGYLSSDPEDDVHDIELSDMTSVEVRFGPGLTQNAHRFTVPRNAGTTGDGGPGVTFPEYIYEDYVEVPFQVWDTDNNRQLMVSFRDQARDGEYTLIPRNTEGSAINHSREYIFVSKYDYAESPRLDLAQNGGFRKGLMYFMWPILLEDEEAPDWNPNSPPPGKIDIDFKELDVLAEESFIELWENDIVHVDHHAMVAVPIDASTNEFYLLNGNDGGVAYSRDGGENWIEGDASPGYNTSQFYDATKREGFPMYIGGMQDNGTWASYNMANSRRGWRNILSGDGFDVVWKGADSLMVSAQSNIIQRSFSGGSNGIAPAGNIGDWDGQFITSLGWTPESGDAVYSISPSGGPLRTLDFGGTWEALHPSWDPPIFSTSGKVRVSLADPTVVWAGYYLRPPASSSGGRLHVIENAMSPRETINNSPIIRRANAPDFAPSATITGLATHPFSRGTAYVTFSVWCEPKLLRTEDMGRTWVDLSGFVDSDNCESTNGFPDAQVWDVEVFPELPRIIWAGTDIGIFESLDHGQTWAYADNGLPAVSVWRIRIVDGDVVVATHGRGVWSLDLDQVLTAYNQDVSEVPDAFELHGNYPNPFNPSTNISFKVATNSHIRVTVFDLLGRKVATLTDQPYATGTHQIQWDASGVSSGQYIYRMEADGKMIGVKSMVLIK